jgi:hypothetical protein
MAATQHAGGSTRAPLRALVERHRDDIKLAVARHRGRRVRLFGSVARGEEREYSDIDLLVDFAPGSSLFDCCVSTGSSRGCSAIRSTSSRVVA